MQTLFVVTLLMSIGLLTGLFGQVSLAQLSLAGFSAFMLSRFDTTLGFPLAPIAAVAVTVVVGTLVSIPALRVRGVQFAIVTFSLAVVFDDLLFRSPTFVGRGGIAEVEPPIIGGIAFGIFDGGTVPGQAIRLRDARGDAVLPRSSCSASAAVRSVGVSSRCGPTSERRRRRGSTWHERR